MSLCNGRSAHPISRVFSAYIHLVVGYDVFLCYRGVRYPISIRIAICMLASNFRLIRCRHPHHHHPLILVHFILRAIGAHTITNFSFNVDVVDPNSTVETPMDPNNDMGGEGAAAREELRAQVGCEELIGSVTADDVYSALSGAVTRLGLQNVDLTPLRAFADAYDETLVALRNAVDKYCTTTGATAHSDAVAYALTAQIELVEKWIRDILNNGLNTSKKGIIIDLAVDNHSRVRFQLYNSASTYFKYKGLDPAQRVPLPPAIEMMIKVCFPGGGVATFTGFLSKIVGELQDDYEQRNKEDTSSSEGEKEGRNPSKRLKN